VHVAWSCVEQSLQKMAGLAWLGIQLPAHNSAEGSVWWSINPKCAQQSISSKGVPVAPITDKALEDWLADTVGKFVLAKKLF